MIEDIPHTPRSHLPVIVGCGEASRQALDMRLMEAQITSAVAIPASIYTWTAVKPSSAAVAMGILRAADAAFEPRWTRWRRFTSEVAAQIIHDALSLPTSAAERGQLMRCFVKRNDCIYRRLNVLESNRRRYMHYDRQVRKWNARILAIKARHK